MTTYTPVATSEVTDGVPVSPVLFNGDCGVRKEWWWQAGPVDSCFWFYPLRKGVGTMAAWDVFIGIREVLLMKKCLNLKDELHVTTAAVQQKYNRLCTGTAAALTFFQATCAKLRALIEEMQYTEGRIYHEVPMTVHILIGVLSILAGTVGLWAVFDKSAGAAKLYAKLYLWSWPAKVVLAAVLRVTEHRLINEYDIYVSPLRTLVLVFEPFFLLYSLTVSWSFHAVLKKRNKAEASN